MKKWTCIIAAVVFLTAGGLSVEKAYSASMNDYCQLPPFVSNVVAPNIFFAIDSSGSMAWPAYSCTSGTCGVASPAYSASTTYEGYFNPEKEYVCTPDALDCSNSSNVYRETVPTGSPCTTVCTHYNCTAKKHNGQCASGQVTNAPGCSASKPCGTCNASYQTGDCGVQSGNHLNYDNMHRTDLVRWAVTGGSPATCNGSFLAPSCDPELGIAGSYGCNSSISINDTGTVTGGCVLMADNGVRVAVPWDRVYAGLAFNFDNLVLQPRLGVMFFSDSGVRSSGKTYLGDYDSSGNKDATYSYRNFITAINSSDPSGSTPTGPAMWDVLNYFSQKAPQYGGMSVQSGSSTKWKNPMYVYDSTISDFSLVPCTKNFVMLLSDGQWNQPGCTIGSSPYTNSSDPVVPAYQMHMGFTNAQAKDSLGNNISSNVTSVYTLGLFLGGSGINALQNVSMYGSFDTAQGTRTWPGGTSNYPLTSCTMTDCGSGKGSGCTAIPASNAGAPQLDWDSNTDGTPDTYFVSSDALGIKDAIYNAILDTLRRVSSGTAVSILSSSQGSGANIMQAVFYPQKTFDNGQSVSWISDIQNLWYYYDPMLANLSMREDTVHDYILNLSNDRIAEFFYDTTAQQARVHLWSDAGDGTKLNPSSPATVDFDNLVALWKAGKLLWQRSYSSRNIKTSIDGVNFTDFTNANSATLRPYLQAADNTTAGQYIDYARGRDRIDQANPPVFRSRTVSISGIGPYVWKLGDIISSTPAIAGASAINNYNLSAPGGYGDSSYQKFVNSADYLKRGMVFLGANDGMLHAFNMGTLVEKWGGQGSREKGKITDPIGDGVGAEEWAYVPMNTLPYLIYLTDQAYNHLFYVDLRPTVIDLSDATPVYQSGGTYLDCYPSVAPACSSANYWDCPRQTCLNKSDNTVASTSWHTILVGGMGTGGASRPSTDGCDNSSANATCVKTPLTDASLVNVGLSSYFAIDVTNQTSPQLLWEFTNPALGYATTGPAIVRVSGKTDGTGAIDSSTNGRWFAVFVSGPMGPIQQNQFKGTSSQNLKVFILDLKTGQLLRTIDSGITNSFGGAMASDAAADLDRIDQTRPGFYSDDVVYFGYTQYDAGPKTWTKGGVLRLVTNESTDPGTWQLSTVISGTGPVTRAIAKLQDIGHSRLWLYFGSGRYFYKLGADIDDASSRRALYGVTEPCYNGTTNQFIPSCTSSRAVTDLTDQTSSPSPTVADAGWLINLEQSSTTYKAERVVTDPLATVNGAVFFATYEPSAEVCALEGNTYLWGVYYNTGGFLPLSALNGQLMIQVSTGSIEERSLSATFSSSRRSPAIAGKPSSDAPSAQSNAGMQPVRRYMNLKER